MYLSEFGYTKAFNAFQTIQIDNIAVTMFKQSRETVAYQKSKKWPQLTPYQLCPKRVTLRAHFWIRNSNIDYYFASPEIGNPRQNKFGHHLPVALFTKALMVILSPLNHCHALTWLNFCESQWSGPKQSANKVKIVYVSVFKCRYAVASPAWTKREMLTTTNIWN